MLRNFSRVGNVLFKNVSNKANNISKFKSYNFQSQSIITQSIQKQQQQQQQRSISISLRQNKKTDLNVKNPINKQFKNLFSTDKVNNFSLFLFLPFFKFPQDFFFYDFILLFSITK